MRARRPGTLIVCEGHETEPNYFDALARSQGITTLIIPRNHVTDPVQLVGIANERLKSDRGIARAFVVFDTYEHQKYAAGLQRALDICPERDRLKAIPSYPSFEFWLLLHYEDTRAPLNKDQALARLKQHIPNYEKSNARVMDEIVDRFEIAIERARNGWNDAVNTGESNSSTEVFSLIETLLGY